MFKTLYYVPTILWTLLFIINGIRIGEFEFLLTFIFWFNLAFMTAAGVLMHKDKIIGAYLGIAFGVLSIAYDVIYHKINGYNRYVPLEYICVPLIIYYVYCLIAINSANTGACDTKDTPIKSDNDKMNILQERFWSDK